MCSVQYWDALKLCMEQHIPMTEQLIEKLSPTNEMDDVTERNKILEGLGDVCMAQRQYHLATKKYTECGNRIKVRFAVFNGLFSYCFFTVRSRLPAWDF